MRPFIVCHMITSLDGRLLPDRWTDPQGATINELIENHYDPVADTYEAAGWIVGRRTMEHYAAGTRETVTLGAAQSRDIYRAVENLASVGIAFDPSGRLLWDGGDLDGDHVIVVLSECVEDSHLEHLRAQGVSYVFAGADGMDLEGALEALNREFGLDKLLLEGGGKINGAFLKAGLIDEISTLVCPAIDGLAGVPAIYDFDGEKDEQPAKGVSLSLIDSKVLDGGVVWLRHKAHRS
ncbi:RibD family protein [Thalassospira sp. MA62]|nr:RibD family protein [Thalassospira sp. MA62]